MFEIPLALFTCHMVISWFIVIDVEGLCGLNISMQIENFSSVFTCHSQVTCNQKSIKFNNQVLATESSIWRHKTTGDHPRAVCVCPCVHASTAWCVFSLICRVEECIIQLE